MRTIGRAFLDAGIPLNHVGIVVQETTKPRPLFEHDANRPRNPASVMKLVTTFAALDLLGPGYRWKTEAYLGLTAFTLAIRRLQGTIAGHSGDGGVGVLMRYTLRLLTAQHFQRAATLICA